MIWIYSIIFPLFVTESIAIFLIPEAGNNNFTSQMARMLCTKANAESKTDEVGNVLFDFITGMRSLMNETSISEEIEKAKANGELYIVFKKYCQKSPMFKACLINLMMGLRPCLEPELISLIPTATMSVNHVLSYVCYRNGGRLALFIEEDGPECFSKQSKEIRKCTDYLHRTLPNMNAIKILSRKGKCKKYEELWQCMTTALRRCDSPIPAYEADAIFGVIHKAIPCLPMQYKK